MQHSITRVSRSANQTWLCENPNQTHFLIPDPDDRRNDAERLALLEFVMSDLASFALGY